MSIVNIVADFEALGVYLWVDGDQLRFKAPTGVLTEDYKQRLKQHKSDLIEFLSDPVVEVITSDKENRYQPFPLTNLQLAYLVGRNHVIKYGGVGCHSYIELDLPDTDPTRLEQAWHRLIERHDMLRASISQEGQQRILPQVVSPRLIVHDYLGQSQQAAQQSMLMLRERLAHRYYQPDQWPQYELHLSCIEGASVLHFSIDLLIADFASIQILLAELGELYNDPQRELRPHRVSYRDVIMARQVKLKNSKAAVRYQKHKQYWLQRIKTLPMPPELPLAMHVNDGTDPATKVTFNRHHFSLPSAQWKALCEKAMVYKITPSSVVLSAFSEILSRWSRNPAFCLNLTLLNRSTAHPDIRSLVGDFIEVNVLGVNPNPQQSFAQRCLSLQQQLWTDLEHSDFSGIEVLREMSRQQQSNVIIPIVYTSTIGLSGDGLDANAFMHEAKLRYGITQTPQVWLDCQATERGGVLLLDWDVRGGIFQDGVIEQAHEAFCNLLEQLVQDDAFWSATASVNLPAAMQQVRERVNDTTAPLLTDYLHSGFCYYALKTPQALALITQDVAISYLELAQHACTIAKQVKARIQPNERVGIVLDKGVAQIAALLGVLLADATYVPIENSQPQTRRDMMLSDAGVRLVLTSHEYLNADWSNAITPLAVDIINTLLDVNQTLAVLQFSLQNQTHEATQTANKAAYIIYTSGTTGRPKGVLMSHRAALNTVADINQRFAINTSDKVLGLVSFTFDLSIWDIFGTFGAGATLVLPCENKRSDPTHWAQLVDEHQISVWNSVPAQLQMLLIHLESHADIHLNTLRLVMLSGDWIPVTLPDVVRKHLPLVHLMSLGGPTETAIWCVYYPIGEVPEDAYSIPYGTPLTNHRIYILNQHLQDCPDWVSGEMYIAGAGLALGYAGDTEKTKQCFITHPTSGEYLYRSGDIGRYRSDGVIEIQGRDDGQVKVNGHRIESGEVEAAICTHPAVRSAAIVVLNEPLRLAAGVVPKTPKSLDEKDLQASLIEHLNEKLPTYMIPSHISLMSKLPLNANSKVDKNALREQLNGRIISSTNFEAPLDTTLEQQVALIWRDLLNVEQISRNDDFFHIGGSSLTAINLLSAYLAQGYSADIDLIFNHSVFRDMVKALAQSNAAKTIWLDSIDLKQMATQALSNIGSASSFDLQTKISKVLLTGASGYLGIYVLNRLLAQTDYQIVCLLRCDSPEHGMQRLCQAAVEKGLGSDLDVNRLVIIPGELSQPNLGLSETQFSALSNEIDVIIHNASIINLMDPLSVLYPTNVEGVKRIIHLASTGKVKPIHYVSTIGVHHALPEDTPQPVLEQTSVVDWQLVELTYEQSKIMAETLLSVAREQGVPVNILRPGTITWARQGKDSQTPFINDDAFFKFYLACLDIHAYPISSLAVNIVPVDYVADCIVAIACSETGQSRNYHLVSEHSPQVEKIYDWFNELGCHIEALAFDKWKKRLNNNFVFSFVNLYFRDGMDVGGHHQYSSKHLTKVRAKFGLSGFDVSKDYLKILTDQYNNASK